MGRCWRCKRSKSDVILRSCEDRLCDACSDYNDDCLRSNTLPDWETFVNQTVPKSSICNDKSVNDSNVRDVDTMYNRNIIDPLLAYTLFSLQSASTDQVKRALLGLFTEGQITEAKDALWSISYFSDIIGDKKSHKNTNTRSKREADMTDIITALGKLDRANSLPTILIPWDKLHMIPRSHPMELNDLSIIDRLNKLEARMSRCEERTDDNTLDNLKMNDRVTLIESSKPSYAVVTRGTSPKPVTPPPGITISDDSRKMPPPSKPIQRTSETQPKRANGTLHQSDSNVEAKFKSFKLDISLAQSKLMFSESMWPSGVRVRQFIPPRPERNSHDV